MELSFLASYPSLQVHFAVEPVPTTVPPLFVQDVVVIQLVAVPMSTGEVVEQVAVNVGSVHILLLLASLDLQSVGLSTHWLLITYISQ